LEGLKERMTIGFDAMSTRGSKCQRLMTRDQGGQNYRARIFKLVRSPRIDSNEPIPPGCVAWRAGTTTQFVLGS
jgi:hypothetical protein